MSEESASATPALVPVSDADHVQLSRLVTEAAWLVDLGESDRLHELFVDDGTLNMGTAAFEGHDQIRRWGIDAVSAHTYDGIRHVAGNMRFFRTGPDTASGVTVLTVYFDDKDEGAGTSVPWVVGEDHDTFVRTPDGWRLRNRSWVSLFVRPSQDCGRSTGAQTV